MEQVSAENARPEEREPELPDFINFIDDETLLPSDPLFSCEALREYTNSKPDKMNMKSKLKVYDSYTKEPGFEDSKH